MLFAETIPVSPNLTDPSSWGNMVSTVGVPMGILMIAACMFSYFTYILLRWLFAPGISEQQPDGSMKRLKDGGIVREACSRWVDAQVAALNGIRVDIDALKDVSDKVKVDHQSQQLAHAAMKQAGHKALNVLNTIGAAVKVDVSSDIQAAHDSLNQA
jgi:hypothetical protein